jgi:hypothetical protein
MRRAVVLFCGLVVFMALTSWAGVLDRQSHPEPKAGPVSGQDLAATDAVPVTFDLVEPVFASRCIECHSGPQPPEKLWLDGYDAILNHRERARVVPGFPLASEVIRRICGLSRPPMPLDQPALSAEEIDRVEAWIIQGARSVENVPASLPVGARVRLGGTVSSTWALDGLPLLVDGGTSIDDAPAVGTYVEVRGVVEPDGAVRAVRIKRR